jgi:hypothetical protein
LASKGQPFGNSDEMLHFLRKAKSGKTFDALFETK